MLNARILDKPGAAWGPDPSDCYFLVLDEPSLTLVVWHDHYTGRRLQRWLPHGETGGPIRGGDYLPVGVS